MTEKDNGTAKYIIEQLEKKHSWELTDMDKEVLNADDKEKAALEWRDKKAFLRSAFREDSNPGMFDFRPTEDY